MKAIQVTSFGEPEVLKSAEVPIPTIQEGQILVKVMATGVNPVETYRRSGNYAILPALPWVPGTDGAGVIEKVFGGFPSLKVGDRVWFDSATTGSYAQYAAVRAVDAHLLPDHIQFTQGAALGIPYGTAYHALFHIGEPNLAGPNTILVHGASGGVGTACIEFAKILPNSIIIGSAGTAEGCNQLKALGAHHVFNHKTDDIVKLVADLTDGKGVDILIEMLANINLGDKDLKCLALKGRVVVVGNRGSVEINPRDLMQKRASVRGAMLPLATPEEKKEINQAIQKGLSDGTLKPVVGKTFNFEQAPASHTHVINPPSGAFGKVSLLPWE